MADLRTALEGALGPLYRVEREVRPVGECRMFVALAEDAGPELLVKVLPSELSLSADAEAFERELLHLAGRLGHPRLVAPRGGGRAGAFVYHTRPFVAGTTLRALLTSDGELPLHRTVEILRDVLEALAHVHAANLASGDVKPENVLLAEGRAVVADVGVVDAVRRSLPAGARGRVSAALCAPAYVAPERHDSAVAGPRDDIFAVGVLAHEMLTGRPPEPEGDALEEIRALPPWLAELVRRSLALDPVERWEHAGAALATVGRPSGGRT